MDDFEVGDEASAGGLGPIFPLSRVKKIMKSDKDVQMCSADAVLFTAMAAENFLEFFSDAICRKAEQDKRKTIAYKDAANAVREDPRLAFLAPLIPPQVPMTAALEMKKKVSSKIKQDMEIAEEQANDM